MSEYLKKISDEEIAKAKETKKGLKLNLIEFELDDDSIFQGIFTAPSTDSFQRYQAAAGEKDDKNGLNSSIRYVKDNIVCPTWDEFYEIHKVKPALVIQVANELVKGMGFINDVKKKAL